MKYEFKLSREILESIPILFTIKMIFFKIEKEEM